MSDHEDHTPDERLPETSTVSGSQNMPSANAFADMFKAAMAPVLSQLTNLNENVSSMLLHWHDDADEAVTASNDEPAKSADMDADLSALLASAGKDANNEAMPGEDLLKELAQDLTVSEKTSPPLREGLELFLIIFCRKRWGTISLNTDTAYIRNLGLGESSVISY